MKETILRFAGVFALAVLGGMLGAWLFSLTGMADRRTEADQKGILELVALCGGPAGARVLGIDIDIRPHNRAAIEVHPLSRRIDLLQGSSTDPAIVAEVKKRAEGAARVLVLLDSNHTHEHVLEELRAYAPLVTVGSYCVVFDTIIAEMPDDSYPDRPWTREANPRSAIAAYMAEPGVPHFEIDSDMDARLLVTVAPGGFLRRVG